MSTDKGLGSKPDIVPIWKCSLIVIIAFAFCCDLFICYGIKCLERLNSLDFRVIWDILDKMDAVVLKFWGMNP